MPIEAQDIAIQTVVALENAWGSLAGFIPSLIGALLILIIGWIVAIALGRLGTQILRAFRVDHAVEKVGAKKAIQKAGYKFDVSQLFGGLVRWFFIIVAVMAGAEVLGLPRVTDFLGTVLLYVPNIIVAVVILLIGILVSNFLAGLVRGSVRVAGLASSDALAAMTRWAVLIFSFLLALNQLGVGSAIIETLVTGFVAMLAIAGGLAFGLGGKDQAKEFLQALRKEMRE